MSIKAWYFAEEDELLRYGDGRKISEGTTHSVEGPIEICKHGLHASRRIVDALKHAPGSVLYEVELSGEIDESGDKIAAEHRKYLLRVDAEDLLNEFARGCALSVIHSWDAPSVVKEFLETGNEELRDAARAAALAGARASARSSVWSAAQDAADAAWSAAGYAACDAARLASRAAASSDASSAAQDAVGSAARAAAWDAARDAAKTQQEKVLLSLVEKYAHEDKERLDKGQPIK